MQIFSELFFKLNTLCKRSVKEKLFEVHFATATTTDDIDDKQDKK